MRAFVERENLERISRYIGRDAHASFYRESPTAVFRLSSDKLALRRPSGAGWIEFS